MYREKTKKGQAASGAAIVIIIITVLIILYVLFIPPQNRAELLGEDSGGGVSGIEGGKGVLFSQSPGRIYPNKANFVEHTMPSFMVFTVTNADEFKRVDNIYVKNSAFSDKTGELIFIYEPKTMEDLKLSFNVKESSGRLIIKLNDHIIFEGELDKGSPQPINIPKEILSGRNTVTFEVSDQGIAFWRYNEYDLRNVLISGKITDYSAALSEQHFSIIDSEMKALEKSVLEFLPDCPPRENGRVQLLINNRIVYNTVPDCGVKTTIEISKEFFRAGDNVLVATTNQGSFLVDMPKVTTFLKQTSQPVFYFNVPAQLYDALYFGEAGIMITLRFADAKTTKRGLIDVNGFTAYFETTDVFYQTVIQPDSIFSGNNALKITPQSDPVDVAELRIDVI